MKNSKTLGCIAMLLCLARMAGAQEQRTGHATFLSPHASPIAVSGGRVFVVNTPSGTVDILDVAGRAVIRRVPVGIDPVGIAVRPDGKEVWVTNHISDSVSVIDTDPASPTLFQVLATVQDLDPVTRATRFDEPVGVAFAGNRKAYVALSSENRIAVVDVATRRVVRTLAITAQDPRALVVRGGRLYVIPFESNNQTQISGCIGPIDGELCTFSASEHVVNNNNVLSTGIDVDIVRHPEVPDRDLYIFDTSTDQLVRTVNTLGTLLYGLAVDSKGRVFVAQTDARNTANGRAGTLKHGLAEMQNRAFLNRITRVDCEAVSTGGGFCAPPRFFDLEPLPPVHPAPGAALATPFAIQISADDSTLVATAAGSDKLFTVDAASGEVLGRVSVGAMPRGIALESAANGKPLRAWVLNAGANTVSLVDVSNPAVPKVVRTLPLADPTHPAVKRGRIAFNDASASTTGTFSCASCHPDGHTDQLVWVLDTPICDVAGCTQIPPRITMPIRGLRDTAPYHWDGIPGDPYGGNNTANIFGGDPPNCDRGRPESCTRDLVDRSLATTMCKAETCPVNDEGKVGALSGARRDDMAKFLLSVSYPPSQRRSYTNVMSSLAAAGFKSFHIDGDSTGNVCGRCHRMPFWVSTNTPGTGMEAPTWRGAYDRWLILPQGRRNVIDLVRRFDRDNGFPEQSIWGASNAVWQMVLEGSTGFPGAFARGTTLNRASAGEPLTRDLLSALERTAQEGGVVLQGEGALLDTGAAVPIALQYVDGAYVERDGGSRSFTRGELLSLAVEGRFVGTFTARLGHRVDVDHPQPGIWSGGAIQDQRPAFSFPTLSGGNTVMVLGGRHIREGAHLIVDGRRVAGNVSCQGGELPDCDGERIVVEPAALPTTGGMHFLQIQNPAGLFSNDFIFHTEARSNAFDLHGQEIQFLRRPRGMAAVRARIGFKDQLGDRVALGDNEARFFEFPDGEIFDFGDASYGGFWVHSDGHLTFGASDAARTSRDVGRFLDGPPRIAALFSDLDPSAATGDGGVYVAFLPNRARVTWRDVPSVGGGLNTVQVTLFYQTGRILMVFGDRVEASTAVVGVRAYGGALQLVDFTAQLPLRPSEAAVAESFGD